MTSVSLPSVFCLGSPACLPLYSVRHWKFLKPKALEFGWCFPRSSECMQSVTCSLNIKQEGRCGQCAQQEQRPCRGVMLSTHSPTLGPKGCPSPLIISREILNTLRWLIDRWSCSRSLPHWAAGKTTWDRHGLLSAMPAVWTDSPALGGGSHALWSCGLDGCCVPTACWHTNCVTLNTFYLSTLVSSSVNADHGSVVPLGGDQMYYCVQSTQDNAHHSSHFHCHGSLSSASSPLPWRRRPQAAYDHEFLARASVGELPALPPGLQRAAAGRCTPSIRDSSNQPGTKEHQQSPGSLCWG